MSEAFLSRWSRLKRAPDEQGEAGTELPGLGAELPNTKLPSPKADASDTVALIDQEPTKKDSSLSDETASDNAAEQSDAEPTLLTDEDMPDLESINARSDVSMFFSTAVSPELRSQALKKLFHQPEFNVRDPLDEYADDYSNMPLLDRKVAATLKGWVGEQVKAALLAEEEAAQQADLITKQIERHEVQQTTNDDSSEPQQSGFDIDQSPESEFPRKEEHDQTK